MQTAVGGLRTACRRTRQGLLQLQAHPTASSSRATFQWDARRTMWRPMDWLRKIVNAQEREKDRAIEVKEARKRTKESGEASPFEYEVSKEVEPRVKEKIAAIRERTKAQSHLGKTETFRISHRKLNLLANQIAGKPIDMAVLQMQFSDKRAAMRVENMLLESKKRAISRGLSVDRLVVAEAWVNKGEGGQRNKTIEYKGRGRVGLRTKYRARMVVRLQEGRTVEEKKDKERERRLRKIVSAGLVREDVPLRNPPSQWAW